MSFLGMESQEGDQVGAFEHSSLSIYEHTNEHPDPIHKYSYNFFVEESSLPVASPVYEDFEEVSRPTLYDEYDDIFL